MSAATATAPQGRPETGRFQPGQSGNPGGRPKGIEKYARQVIGGDGKKLIDFWWDVATDDDQPMKHRLEASKLLADRGFGRPSQALTGADGGPIQVEHTDVSMAKERFGQSVDELAQRRHAKAGTDG